MLKIIIIDDEVDAIDVLESILQVNKKYFKIVAKTTNPIEGLGLILEHKPDVVFLDIEMPEITGFQLLESIPVVDFEIIFTTAYENYAIKAIKENALDYILKPATFPEVLGALEKVRIKKQKNEQHSNYKTLIKDLNNNKFNKLRVPTLNGFELIDSEDVVYLEADGAYTIAYLINNEKLLLSKSIKLLQSFLNRFFFRSHRSYIVNLNHIKRFNREKFSIEMSNNMVVPLSRRRYDTFNEYLENIEM